MFCSSKATRDKGSSYFSLHTGSRRSAVENLVRGLELKDIHTILASYAEALLGRKLQLRSSSMFYKNLPGLSRFFSVTDGTRIFLPSQIDLFRDGDLNFKTYKWMLTHELGHLLFGTYTIGKEELRIFSETGNPVQALKIFEFLEDERVDYLLGVQYPGLAKDRIAIMDAFFRMKGGPELSRSVFETLSYRVLEAPVDSGGTESRLSFLLKEALSKVIAPDCTVQQVLELAN